MPLDPKDLDDIKHCVEDTPKTLKDKLNGSFKPLMIGGGITLTALITWVFSAGGKDVELKMLSNRMDKIEPQVLQLTIDASSLKTTVMIKLDEISRQIKELKEDVKTHKN